MHTYVCTYVRMYIRTVCMYIRMYIHTYILYVCTYIYTCVSMYVCMHAETESQLMSLCVLLSIAEGKAEQCQ